MGKNKKKKGNLFTADVAMAYRVAEYIRIKIYGVVWQTRLKKDITTLEEKKKNALDMLNDTVFSEYAEEVIKKYDEQLTEKKAYYAKKLEENEKFKYTAEDLAVYEDYKNGKDMTKSLTKWFAAYKMDVVDTILLDDLIDAISGKKQASNRVIVQSGAKQFTDIRSKNDVLRTLYSELATKMIEAGTLKPSWLPSDIVEFYTPKKKSNK